MVVLGYAALPAKPAFVLVERINPSRRRGHGQAQKPGIVAEQAAEAGGKFSAKSPTGAEVVALASIALSLSVIAEAMAGPDEAKA